MLRYTKNILVSDIHTRFRTKEILKEAGAEIIYSLDEILSESINGSGYNKDYGLLGSNYSTDEALKLFPRDGQIFVNNIQNKQWKKLVKSWKY